MPRERRQRVSFVVGGPAMGRMGRKGGKKAKQAPEPEPEPEPDPPPPPPAAADDDEDDSPPPPPATASDDAVGGGSGGGMDDLFSSMMAPVEPKLTEAMAEAVDAVKAVLAAKQGETDFKKSVALLKVAIASDKKGRKQESVLMYLAAASSAAAVAADAGSSSKQKDGLAKKLPAMDTRIATALKSSRALFDELDEDNSGTIDESEFGTLMSMMQMAVEEGQFGSIDKDGSGAIEYDEFVSWCAETGLQQNHEAFQAGWSALQEREGLDLVSELERMGLKEAVSAARGSMAEADARDKKRRRSSSASSAASTSSSSLSLKDVLDDAMAASWDDVDELRDALLAFVRAPKEAQDARTSAHTPCARGSTRGFAASVLCRRVAWR
eukprot:COSAG06_NODE_10386_length_1689_cov_6.594969_2_plen_382_part_00